MNARKIIKSAICALLAFLMAVSLAACSVKEAEPMREEASALKTDTEPTAVPTAEPTPEPTPVPTPEPVRIDELIESLLPDWELHRADDRTYSYRGINSGMMDDYIDLCKSKGFEYLRAYEDSNTQEILYRDDIWIEISDSARWGNSGGCSLTFLPGMYQGGITGEEAVELIGTEGTGYTPAAAIDRSTEGMFEATGMQLFYFVYDLRPGCEKDTGFRYITRYFLVGGGEKHYADLLLMWGYGDIDSDGSAEVVTFGVTDISMRCAFRASVFRSDEGRPVRVRYGLQEVGANIYHGLASHDGKLYFVTAPRNYDDPNGELAYGEKTEHEIRMDRNFLTVDDPDVLFKSDAENFVNEEYDAHEDELKDKAWETLLLIHQYQRLDAEFDRENCLMILNAQDALPPYSDATFYYYPVGSGPGSGPNGTKNGSIEIHVRMLENGEWVAELDESKVHYNLADRTGVNENSFDRYLKELKWPEITVSEKKLKEAGFTFEGSDEAAACAASYLGERIAKKFTSCGSGNYFRCESAGIVAVDRAEAGDASDYYLRLAVWPKDPHMFMRGFNGYQSTLYGLDEYPEFFLAMTFRIGVTVADLGGGNYRVSVTPLN